MPVPLLLTLAPASETRPPSARRRSSACTSRPRTRSPRTHSCPQPAMPSPRSSRRPPPLVGVGAECAAEGTRSPEAASWKRAWLRCTLACAFVFSLAGGQKCKSPLTCVASRALTRRAPPGPLLEFPPGHWRRRLLGPDIPASAAGRMYPGRSAGRSRKQRGRRQLFASPLRAAEGPLHVLQLRVRPLLRSVVATPRCVRRCSGPRVVSRPVPRRRGLALDEWAARAGDGAPAAALERACTATAVGHSGSALSVSCLALPSPGVRLTSAFPRQNRSRPRGSPEEPSPARPPQPLSQVGVENPRQVAAYRYSAEFGPRPPSFARATAAPRPGARAAAGSALRGRLLLRLPLTPLRTPPRRPRLTTPPGRPGSALLIVGGTAAVVGERSACEGGLSGQLEETCRNLARRRPSPSQRKQPPPAARAPCHGRSALLPWCSTSERCIPPCPPGRGPRGCRRRRELLCRQRWRHR